MKSHKLPLPSSAITQKWSMRRFTLFGVCLLICGGALQTAEAHILVYRRYTSQELIYTFSQLIEEYNDLPAQFGPGIPSNGVRVFPLPADPPEGCTKMSPPQRHGYPEDAKFVAIIRRGGENCSFAIKVRNAQAANFHAAIVYNKDSDELEQMSAVNGSGIHIPSVFVGETSGMSLISYATPEIVVVINDELPFNINTQLILPFSILMGICFLAMIFYMIYKCIREQRRGRRHRLPKSMLKKLPILKYTKNCDLGYDTCVICLDEFAEGDKLRVLPCRHPYHSHCIDPWLTENRRVCPVCKRKVFTKGEARSLRNRQSSLDSVTDTDDDTTPLLQPPRTAALRSGETAGRAATTTTTTAATPARRGGAAAAGAGFGGGRTTRHGTFRRGSMPPGRGQPVSNIDSTSDEENVLSSGGATANVSRSERVNPFDRTPNSPPSNRSDRLRLGLRSVFTYPINWFRRPASISVAAPPFLEEGGRLDSERPPVVHTGTTTTVVVNQPAVVIGPPSAGGIGAAHSSNNILNPNLSGSFKNKPARSSDSDDDDNYFQADGSIYEPSGAVVVTAPRIDPREAAIHDVSDSVFIQTPTQGGIGVVALPNDSNVGGNANIPNPSRRDYLV